MKQMRDVTWEDLTIRNLQNIKAYRDWAWLMGEDPMKPVLVTKFGDLFYQKENGQIFFLDMMEGTITHIANSHKEFLAFINVQENVVHYLLSNLVHALINLDRVPSDQQCYAFTVLPAMGGEIVLDNVEIRDAGDTISLTAQAHKKLHDNPEGYRVTEVILENQ